MFSQDIRDEIAHMWPTRICCQRALFSSLLLLGEGVVGFGEGGDSLCCSTDSAATARLIVKLARSLYQLSPHVTALFDHSGKHHRFRLKFFSRNLLEDLRDLGILDRGGRKTEGIRPSLVQRRCCKRAYLRGVFLACGSMNSLRSSYHLELIPKSSTTIRDLILVLQKLGVQGRSAKRRGREFLYVKKGEDIARFLNIIGAYKSLLRFEESRAVKETKNEVQRRVNCETGNISRQADAAGRQIRKIRLLKRKVGLKELPPLLREVADLRLRFPDQALSELGAMLSPPMSKSGIRHRLERLELLADEL
ncbi:MAG: DNA-binding protein WhiA [Armatimonadetes bacterium]|nr:DNA-binding protein WhiA [Armatimonadota bacterium]